MRKNVFTGIVVASSILLMAAKGPGEIDRLIKAHHEACGGEIALWNTQTITRTGSIIFYNQNPVNPVDKYSFLTELAFPNQIHELIKNDEQTLLERGTDGIDYWSWDGNQFTYLEEDDTKYYLKTAAEQASRELLFVKENVKDMNYLERNPDWAPNEAECFQGVKIRNDKEITYCFDKTSHFLAAEGGDLEYRMYENYRSIGTILIPFHIVHYKQGLIAYEVQLHQAKQDEALPDDHFTFPKPAVQEEYDD